MLNFPVENTLAPASPKPRALSRVATSPAGLLPVVARMRPAESNTAITCSRCSERNDVNALPNSARAAAVAVIDGPCATIRWETAVAEDNASIMSGAAS